jgi:hypothetical protein
VINIAASSSPFIMMRCIVGSLFYCLIFITGILLDPLI